MNNILAFPGYLATISACGSPLLCGVPHFLVLLVPSARGGGLSSDFSFTSEGRKYLEIYVPRVHLNVD